MYTNECVISSNNSINENKYNMQRMEKSTAAYKIKKILKPLLKMLKNKKAVAKQQQHYFESNLIKTCDDFDFWQSSPDSACPCDDNSANEELEARIFQEIEQCEQDAGVYVYNDELGACELKPVERDQQFVPVHFARTNAGTFFWTTMNKDVDCDLVQPTYCCSYFQQPELQCGDRWVQA